MSFPKKKNAADALWLITQEELEYYRDEETVTGLNFKQAVRALRRAHPGEACIGLAKRMRNLGWRSSGGINAMANDILKILDQ